MRTRSIGMKGTGMCRRKVGEKGWGKDQNTICKKLLKNKIYH